MLMRLFLYIQFLLKSTNEHGVHSPFVFNYITQCLYKKPRKSKTKTLDILLKSSSYFSFKTIKVIGSPDYEKIIENHFPQENDSPKNIDLLYLNSSLMLNKEQLFIEFKLKNDSLILIDNIYKTKEEYATWNDLVASKKVAVSIDMYYCGVLSIRKEQEKEHFTIRI